MTNREMVTHFVILTLLWLVLFVLIMLIIGGKVHAPGRSSSACGHSQFAGG